jgi:uncharacterized hydrophobic protein (TIGR00271 family)
MHVTPADVERMRDALFFDGASAGPKYSRFWLLLMLAAVIASAGVIADSTATVTGAMIVAPLMTPILGMALAAALTDRRNLRRSILLVLGGTASVIAIGYMLGLLSINPVVAEVNSQVAGRVSPRLIDLVAALATGAVGAFALSRSDISDTLPGVAIAISLVPPLAVVGLTMESGAYAEAAGALLLFVTNVTAILASGTTVFALYGIHRHAAPRTGAARRGSRTTIVIVAMVIMVAVPLAVSSVQVARATAQEAAVRSAATSWAEPLGWTLLGLWRTGSDVVLRLTGPEPVPDPTGLRAALDAEGLTQLVVQVELVPGTFATVEPTAAASPRSPWHRTLEG